MHKTHRMVVLFLAVVLGLLSLGACRAAKEGSTAVATTQVAEVTRITDASPPATYVWKQPTTIIKTEVAAETATPTPASDQDKLIARGKGLYEKLECNTCHGENGEGLSDKGAKLAGTSLTEEEFNDVLRTGGKGELGNEHLYGTSAISESGIQVVYLFLQSLAP